MIRKLINKIFVIDLLTYFMSIVNVMADVGFASKFLGVQASAACGYAMPILTFAFAIGSMLRAGTQSLCGKFIGESKLKEANIMFNTALFLSVAFSIVIGIVGLFFSPILAKILGANPSTEIFSMTCDFISSLSIALPAIMIVQVAMPVMQIDNDRNRGIVAAAVLGVSNIILVIISLNFTNLGLYGIGLSTSIGFYISLVILLLHFARKQNIFKISFIQIKNLRLTNVKKILLQGLPYAIANFCNAIFNFYMNSLLLYISDENAIAAFTIINSLITICIGVGTSLGSTTLLTSNILYGERNKEMLIDLVKSFILKSIIFNIVLMILINVFCENLVLLFTNKNNEIFSTIVYSVRLYSLSLVFYSISSCFRNLIQGSGHILLTQIECVLQNLVFPIIFSLLLAVLFGYNEIWWFYIFFEVATLIFIVILSKCITKGKLNDWSTYLFVGNDYFPLKDSYINIQISNIKDIENMYSDIMKFASVNSLEENFSKTICLVAEESIMNIINHGIKDNKKNSIILRIINYREYVTLHIRDNCHLFNPELYIKQHFYDDSDFNKNGMNIVYQASSWYGYNDALSLNNFRIIIVKTDVD